MSHQREADPATQARTYRTLAHAARTRALEPSSEAERQEAFAEAAGFDEAAALLEGVGLEEARARVTHIVEGLEHDLAFAPEPALERLARALMLGPKSLLAYLDGLTLLRVV